MVVNEDHYINRVFHDAGRYELTVEEFGSPYVASLPGPSSTPTTPTTWSPWPRSRTSSVIEAASDRPFEPPDYDAESLDRTRSALLALAADLTSFQAGFGRQEDVDQVRHLIGTAAGWGGLPDTEATYVGVSPDLPVGEYALTIRDDVPVDGFWSISVYNADGFFEPNEQGAYSVNNITAARNDDGSVTVRFGGDGDNASLPLTDGWNYLVRLYRPRAEILSGAWTFPTLAQ